MEEGGREEEEKRRRKKKKKNKRDGETNGETITNGRSVGSMWED